MGFLPLTSNQNPIAMNRLLKKLTALTFVGLLAIAIVTSCGQKAKEGDHPTDEAAKDSTDHPAGEHPSDSTDHPSDTTKKN
jgi:hypothetical protein